MNILEAHRRANMLANLAASNPDSEEGRTAGALACKLIREHGLLIIKPSDLVSSLPISMPGVMTPPLVTVPPIPAPAAKKRRRRPTKQEISEAADTAVTALDAAGRVATAIGGFASVLRGGR